MGKNNTFREYKWPINFYRDVFEIKEKSIPSEFAPPDDLIESAEYLIKHAATFIPGPVTADFNEGVTLIILHYKAQKSIADISKVTGISQKRIESSITRAMMSFRHPSRSIYLQSGIHGVIEKEKEKHTRLHKEISEYKEKIERLSYLLAQKKAVGQTENATD